MWWYVVGPLLVPVIAVVICLNFKAGFKIADATKHTKFSEGYYMVTVLTLFAIEGSVTAFIINEIVF